MDPRRLALAGAFPRTRLRPAHACAWAAVQPSISMLLLLAGTTAKCKDCQVQMFPNNGIHDSASQARWKIDPSNWKGRLPRACLIDRGEVSLPTAQAPKKLQASDTSYSASLGKGVWCRGIGRVPTQSKFISSDHDDHVLDFSVSQRLSFFQPRLEKVLTLVTASFTTLRFEDTFVNKSGVVLLNGESVRERVTIWRCSFGVQQRNCRGSERTQDRDRVSFGVSQGSMAKKLGITGQ